MTRQADDGGARLDPRQSAGRPRVLGVHRRDREPVAASPHILEAELAQMVFERRVGRDIIDRGVDGSESRWERVLAYDPPNRVVISWDINTRWQIETDPERTSEVGVRFVAERTAEHTR